MKFLGEIENTHDVVNKSYVESLIEGTATDIASQLISEALQDNATQTWVNQQGFLTEHQSLDGYVNEIATTGTGNAVTSISKNGKKLTFTKGATYLTTTVANGLYHPLITESAKLAASLVSGLATVATSGSYNDLSNKPTIPTNTNQLTNGAGYITSSALSSYLPLSGGTLTGQLTIKSSTTSGDTPKLYFQRGTTADDKFDYYIYSTSKGLTFGNSRSGTNSNLVRVTSTALYPTSDNTYNLGASDYKWNNVYTTLINGGTPIHSGNYSSYALPLSGGTMTGPITLTSGGASAYTKTALSFTNADGSSEDARIGTSKAGHLGIYCKNTIYLKPDNQMNAATTTGITLSATKFTYNDYKVWHAGNDGSGSGLDADLLDGVQGSDYLRKAYGNNSKHQIDIMNLDAIADSASNWTNAANTDLKLVANNNAMVFTVSYTSNQRKAFIQVGHSALSYGHVLGDLYLNKFGGNVYIGETLAATINSNVASATKLHTARTIWGQSFDGTGNVSGALTGVLSLQTNSNYGIWRGDAFTSALTANDLVYNANSHYFIGNVGIGTTSPLSKLHVEGAATIGIESSTAPYSSINFRNTDTDLWQISARFNKNVSANNDVMKFYYCNGSTWEVTMALYTTGNLLVAGGITQYSDIRKKTKLQDVELSLKQVANAPLIEHYYNSDDKKTTHVGSIAQYWAEMNDWFCKLDSDGYYTMEIQNAALASAISVARELERYESKTDKKIRLLKKRINELEDEIEKLKSA